MNGIFGFLSSLLAIVAIIMNAYMAAAPKREERQRDEKISQGRIDISDGNVAAVEQRIDRVCRTEDDLNAGIQGGND